MTDYYVHNKIGNDSNPGTESAPVKTIGRGVDLAGPSDMVRIVPTDMVYKDYFSVTKSGTVSAPITIASASATDAPSLNPGNSWQIKGDWWILDGLDFNHFSARAVQIGGRPYTGYGPDNLFANNVAIRLCNFRHGSQDGIQIAHGANVVVENCLFRDIRKRVPNQDQCALNVYGGGPITIHGCTFEDIGSDGVHIGPWFHDVGDVLIEDCTFITHRPYGSVPWQDWGRSVGENAIDVKAFWASPADPYRLHGIVTIRDCTCSGFTEVYPGQDCSDGTVTQPFPQAAVVVHMDAKRVIIDECIVRDSNRGIAVSAGSGGAVTASASISGGIIQNCDQGIVTTHAEDGLAVRDTVIDCEQYLYVHSSPVTFEGNYVARGGYVRNAQEGKSEVFNANTWRTDSVPDAWKSSTDSQQGVDPLLVKDLNAVTQSLRAGAGQADALAAELRSDAAEVERIAAAL